MTVLKLLSQDNFLMYNLNIATQIGVKEAILIGELARKWNYWNKENRLDENGYFYITQEDIEKDTGLSPYQQRQAFKSLVDKGYVIIKLKGIPAVNYYKIVEDKLLNIFTSSCEETKSQMLKNLTTSCEETLQLDVKKLDTTNTEKTNTRKEEITKEISEDSNKKEDVFYWIDFNVNKSTDFIEMLKKWFTTQKKKPTIWQLKNKLAKLYKKYPNENQQLDIITNCALNGWQGWEDYSSNNKSSNLYKQEETNSSSWSDIVS